MDIAIVILNWNGRKLLETYLPSVITHSENAKIYVADNASTDDSLEFIAHNYPEVIIIKNDKNYGFAGGYNKALNLVEEDLYVLLNNDVEVTHRWLEGIKSVFEKKSKVAVVQPKLKSLHQPNKFDYAGAAGGFIDSLGYPFCRGRIFDHIEEDSGQYEDESEIFWASGACFAIKRNCFIEAGGFDEDYFAHQEEIDLCWRLKNLDYSVWYTPKSEVFHLGGGTLASSSPRKTFLNFRNSLFNLLKNSKKNPFGLIFIRMLLDGVAALRFLLQAKVNHFLAIFKAHVNFYIFFTKMYNKRKTLKKIKHKFIVSSIVWHGFVLNVTRFKKLNSDNN
ncbi:glycosyltransferase family 2 protein [Psychroflexus tropicus]|uniref:glycosyltransferase family 2 protein n=1 Tax=Psychroflexus tropicus TaxID=197345 RepID=UPI00037B80AD|nr:glycosyltransferase family 2 protein [Psychroflexus tropicus]